MTDRPTYPQLLKLFYKHSFPDKLGAPASAVAQAIIYKSNELWFPAEFAMSNKELSQLSGEKLSNIGRTRQKVLDVCVVDGQPLFIYVNGKQRRAGKYKINFNLTSTQLQDDFKMTSNSRQKQPEIDNDPNSTLLNRTKHNLPPTPHNVTTSEGLENENSEGGVSISQEEEERTIIKVKHIQSLIVQKYSKQLKEPPTIGRVKDALREFGGDHRKLVMAITKAANTLNTPTPQAALNLVITIARNYENVSGATDEQLAEKKQEIKEMEAGLLRATEAEDEAAISQLGYLIEQKKESLARLQG